MTKYPKNKRYTYRCDINPEHEAWVKDVGPEKLQLCKSCYNLERKDKTFFAVNRRIGIQLGYDKANMPK